jgi:hypothetical protein
VATDAPPATFCAENPDTLMCADLKSPSSSAVIGSNNIDISGIKLDGFTFGSGAGTCPSPKTYRIAGINHSYSYQPLCDFFGYFRPIAIIVATFISGMIIFGQRTTDNA